jgi:hypothetical protein
VHVEPLCSGSTNRPPAVFAGEGVHDAREEGVHDYPGPAASKTRDATWYQLAQARRRRSALGWCRAVIGHQWSLRKTARPRRSPARRRRGRPLCPRSAHGRPLTAAAGARNRAYANDDGKRRGGKRPTRHQSPREGARRFVRRESETGKTAACGVHGSAGINRQRGRNERVLHRRFSEPR